MARLGRLAERREAVGAACVDRRAVFEQHAHDARMPLVRLLPPLRVSNPVWVQSRGWCGSDVRLSAEQANLKGGKVVLMMSTTRESTGGANERRQRNAVEDGFGMQDLRLSASTLACRGEQRRAAVAKRRCGVRLRLEQLRLIHSTFRVHSLSK